MNPKLSGLFCILSSCGVQISFVFLPTLLYHDDVRVYLVQLVSPVEVMILLSTRDFSSLEAFHQTLTYQSTHQNQFTVDKD